MAPLVTGKLLNIEMRRDSVDVTPRLEPDPEWKYVDRKGHGHGWKFNPPFADPEDLSKSVGTSGIWAGDGSFIPHRWIVERKAYKDEEGEEYPEEGHMACPVCAEEVHPGYRAPARRRCKVINQYVEGRLLFTGPPPIMRLEPYRLEVLAPECGLAGEIVVMRIEETNAGFLWDFESDNGLTKTQGKEQSDNG
jgi:hypothetical protein